MECSQRTPWYRATLKRHPFTPGLLGGQRAASQWSSGYGHLMFVSVQIGRRKINRELIGT
jgi:hypothetical protein